MAKPLRVLAQLSPAATTETDLLVATQPLVISAIFVCNQNAVLGKFRLLIAKAGIASSVDMILYYDQEVLGNTTFAIGGGITMAANDVLRCESDTGFLSFNVFGQEQDI